MCKSEVNPEILYILYNIWESLNYASVPVATTKKVEAECNRILNRVFVEHHLLRRQDDIKNQIYEYIHAINSFYATAKYSTASIEEFILNIVYKWFLWIQKWRYQFYAFVVNIVRSDIVRFVSCSIISAMLNNPPFNCPFFIIKL